MTSLGMNAPPHTVRLGAVEFCPQALRRNIVGPLAFEIARKIELSGSHPVPQTTISDLRFLDTPNLGDVCFCALGRITLVCRSLAYALP